MMKRGLYKDSAVVLNSIDYGESDRILTFFTRGRGKLKGIAKGARRSKKRFVGNLDPASHIDIVFFHSEKTEISRVEEARLINGFNGLKSDIEMLSRACYLLEVTSEMTREGLAMPRVFDLLTGSLALLETEKEADRSMRFFEIRLLTLAGYLPHLNGCVVCRKGHAQGSTMKFSSEKGGTVCRDCSRGLQGLIDVSGGTASLLALASRLDEDKLTRLRPGPMFLDESEKILYDFIKYQIGRELKTKRFMARLNCASL